MSDRGSYDAVVVGGGVIGLCCAWRAARARCPRRRPRPRRAAGRRDPRRRRDAGAGRRARLRRAGAAADDPRRRRGATRTSSPSWRRRAGSSTGYCAPRRPARRARPRRGGGAAPPPRAAALARPRRGVAAAAPLPRARAGPDALLQRRRPRSRGGGGRPASLDAALLAALAAEGVEVRARVRGRRGAARRRADRRACARRRRGAARGGRRPRRRRLVGYRRVAARAARPPVRPVKGQILELRAPDGRAGLRADRRLRARLPGARGPTVAWSSAPPSRSAASTPRSPRAGSTSCCARPTGCCPTSPRWSWSSRWPACGPARPTTCR